VRRYLVVCEACGHVFETPYSRGRYRATCSAACKSRLRRATAKPEDTIRAELAARVDRLEVEAAAYRRPLDAAARELDRLGDPDALRRTPAETVAYLMEYAAERDAALLAARSAELRAEAAEREAAELRAALAAHSVPAAATV
jgi:hypothetical protein